MITGITEGDTEQGRNYFMSNPLLTVDELAEALSVPRSWVYSRTRETDPGSIPVLRCGKYCRFRLSDVLAWIESQGGENDCE